MKDKIITLGNGKEFLIVDVCRYNGIDYCFVCEVVNNDTTDSFGVIRIDEIDVTTNELNNEEENLEENLDDGFEDEDDLDSLEFPGDALEEEIIDDGEGEE